MKKILVSLGILVLALSVIGIAAAGGGGGGRDLVKLSLINAAGPADQTYGTVVLNGGKEKVSIDVEVKGLTPNHLYEVYLEINYHSTTWYATCLGSGCPMVGTITTDTNGNGKLETTQTMQAGPYMLGIDVADSVHWTAEFVSDGSKDGVWEASIDMQNPVTVEAGTGFDLFGYNRNARIFVGTGESWSLEQGLPADYLGIYAKDKLVMKWNAEWDRGVAEGWANGPYDAWENNEWNGMAVGGSGSVWHYKIVWVGGYAANPSLIPDGAYGIWGQFATIMDQGIDPSYGPGHQWFAHATPTGYGAYKTA